MPFTHKGQRRIVPRRTRLSVVLRAPHVPHGAPVTVMLGSGRMVEGFAQKLDDEKIRVELPEGVS
jgi:hypothetical protein